MPSPPTNGSLTPAAVPPPADPIMRSWRNPIIEWRPIETVPIMLGDTERHLLYTNKALKAIQAATGKNPLDGYQWDELAHEPAGLAILIWAGLLHENPELTVDEVDDWIVLPRMLYYRERLVYAHRESLPDPDFEDADANQAETGSDPNDVPARTG